MSQPRQAIEGLHHEGHSLRRSFPAGEVYTVCWWRITDMQIGTERNQDKSGMLDSDFVRCLRARNNWKVYCNSRPRTKLTTQEKENLMRYEHANFGSMIRTCTCRTLDGRTFTLVEQGEGSDVKSVQGLAEKTNGTLGNMLKIACDLDDASFEVSLLRATSVMRC